MCNIGRLIKRFCEADQLHELATVAMRIITPRLTRQVFDVVVAVIFKVCSATQFLSKGSYCCRKVKAVTAAGVDTAIHYGCLYQF